MEQITPYLYTLIASGAFFLGGLAGIGGTSKYIKKKNGNGKSNSNWDGNERRNFVSQHECERTHEGLNNQLAEGNRRMGSMEKTLISLNDNVHTLGQGMGQLQGAHKMLAETVMLKF